MGQPHEFCVILCVETPYCIVDNLVSDINFFSKGFFGEVHDGGTDIEILAEFIVQVKPEKSLALGGKERLVFEGHTYALSGVDDALIGDGDYAHGIVDSIVAVLIKHYAAGSDYD